MNKVKYFNYL